MRTRLCPAGALPLAALAALLAACGGDGDGSAGAPGGGDVPARLTDLAEDASRLPEAPGSYEWWNFFAFDPATGLTVSAIFHAANLFDVRYRDAVAAWRACEARGGVCGRPAPGDHPLLQANVARGGRKLFSAVRLPPGARAAFSRETPEGRIGESAFEGSVEDGEVVYRVRLDHPDALNLARVRAELEFRAGAPPFVLADGVWGALPGGERHRWQFPAPIPRVTGRVRVLDRSGVATLDEAFSGGGYADHLWGEGLLGDALDAWDFGQTLLPPERGGLLYIRATPRDAAAPAYGRVLRLRPGAPPRAYVMTAFEGAAPRAGRFGLGYASDVRIAFAAGTLRVRWEADQEDWPFQAAGSAVVDADLPGDLVLRGAPGGAERARQAGIDDPRYRFLSLLLERLPWIP